VRVTFRATSEDERVFLPRVSSQRYGMMSKDRNGGMRRASIYKYAIRYLWKISRGDKSAVVESGLISRILAIPLSNAFLEGSLYITKEW